MNLSGEVRDLLAEGGSWTVDRLLVRIGPAIADADAEAVCQRLERVASNPQKIDPANRILHGKRRLVQEAANRLVGQGIADAEGRGSERKFSLREGANVIKTIGDVSLDILSVDSPTQVREETSEEVVAEYAAAMADGDEFPPITIFWDGTKALGDGPGKIWIGGGFTRIAAARKCGRKTIAAEIRRGTRADAIRFAVADNARHGQRLSVADKEKAVRMYAAEFPGEAVNAIAKACRVSWTFADRLLNPKTYSPDGRTKAKEPPVREREPGDDDEELPPVAPSRAGSKQESDKPKAKETGQPEIRDQRGKVVPKHLRDVFADQWHTDAVQTLERLKLQARSAMNWSVWLAPEVLDDLASAIERIKGAIPFAICGDCAGVDGGCQHCKTGGYVLESITPTR